MRRYQVEAVPLGKEAADRALTDAGLAADRLGLFAVCSCTGYATPGLDILLARDLGMSPYVQRLFVGHMGCYAALPGLGAAADFVLARGRPALLLCAELTSLHLQPAGDPRRPAADRLARALLGRGGRRRAHAGRQPGVRGARGRRRHRQHHGRPHDLGGHRPGLPDGAVAAGAGRAAAARPQAGRRPAGPARAGDRATWTAGRCTRAGRRSSTWCRSGWGSTTRRWRTSREVLAAYGNCSSPTVLLVLDASAPPCRRRRSRVVMLAFGPGLTLYGTLLEASTVTA